MLSKKGGKLQGGGPSRATSLYRQRERERTVLTRGSLGRKPQSAGNPPPPSPNTPKVNNMGYQRQDVALFSCLVLLAALCTAGCAGEDFYSFSVKDHQGQDVALESYRGKVTLVVNVASLCGYTETTYRALKKLHDILGYGGHFSVLAFPCNQFGDQEPLDIEDILEHVTSEYEVEFPVFNKIDVVGPNADPAFRQLIEDSSIVPDWNFYKYLVNGSGRVVGAWGTRVTIEEIFDEVQAEVKKAKEAASPDKKEASPVEGGGKDEL